MTTKEFHHYQHIRLHKNKTSVSSITKDDAYTNICSALSINIDTPTAELEGTHTGEHRRSTTVTTDDIIQFTSSWQRTVVTDDDSYEDHSTSLNIIQMTFTIPYIISNNSILNKTIFIIDVICINGSSFIINYSTKKSLPHDICLYLVLNLTSSTTLKEIIFCRTIDNPYDNSSSSHDNTTAASSTVGPSQFFILSQCIIILIMMFIIYGVQTAREKSLANRVSQRLYRSRPYITIFGNKTTACASSAATNHASTLQAGLNNLDFHRRLASLSHPMGAPIEEQVLAAHDLTSTSNDRRATRWSINRDLIDIKEFTKRMSEPNESSTDMELSVL
jgi:hypothetical protein